MTSFWTNPLSTLKRLMSPNAPSIRQIRYQYSPVLDREVSVDIFLPPDYRKKRTTHFPVLLVNDGQDLTALGMAAVLEKGWRRGDFRRIIVVGIHANERRIREYGTARQPDYKGRGDLADTYKAFIVNELLPYLYSKFRLTDEVAIAGFSLGGLSAFDIGWAEPGVFQKIGVFSGALWWRSKAVNPRDPDADRILFDILLSSKKNDGQRFWFQAGTKDETDDRNHNGIIDAIDDTIQLVGLLTAMGYSDDEIRYLEIDGGTHDPQTWGRAMPDFLKWAFS